MKFTDGYWQHLPGVTVLRPREVADVVVGDDTLTVYASTGPLTSRGDTLNKALVTVSFHSPMDDVIGVRIEHHAGASTGVRPSTWPTPRRTSRSSRPRVPTTASRPSRPAASRRASRRAGRGRSSSRPTAGS